MQCGNKWSCSCPKGALSGLRQFLATENHLKLMKNTFDLERSFSF